MNFKEVLEQRSNLKVDLKIKEYKSTFISISKDRNSLRVSLHKLFENAPQDIKNAIISYCLKGDKIAHRLIKTYANRYFFNLDYSNRLDVKKLVTKGKFFDLLQIYENLNMVYYKNSLNLHITWFEKPKYTSYSHFTFGTFDKNLKLIRINKLLDQANFPFYFINYIVYHEMLHSICEEIIEENGNKKVHTKKFKDLEKKFAYYKEAQEFEKKFLNRGKKYVRS